MIILINFNCLNKFFSHIKRDETVEQFFYSSLLFTIFAVPLLNIINFLFQNSDPNLSIQLNRVQPLFRLFVRMHHPAHFSIEHFQRLK